MVPPTSPHSALRMKQYPVELLLGQPRLGIRPENRGAGKNDFIQGLPVEQAL